jgi:hypothetical protein
MLKFDNIHVVNHFGNIKGSNHVLQMVHSILFSNMQIFMNYSKLHELRNNYLEKCIKNYLAIFKNIVHQG